MGLATDGLNFPAGKHDLCYTFPMLPLRPGPYAWLVSLYDEGVEEVDAWECLPEMIVATEFISTNTITGTEPEYPQRTLYFGKRGTHSSD